MKNQSKKIISVVVPLYNEEENIPLLYKAIHHVFDSMHHDFELLFVNDASQDNSVAEIEKLEIKDPRVRLLDLTRNFGKEAALTAGLQHAKGDAAIMIDADLQHPPEYIPRFLAEWEKGAEIVVGVRDGESSNSWFKNTTSTLFYKVINKISETEITPQATDFRLLDRMAIDEFNKIAEKRRITRGLIDWLGYNRVHVPFVPAPRRHGEAAYNFSKLLNLGMDSVLSMSLEPLRLAGYLGMLITFVAAALGVFILIENYILDDPWHLNISGTAILAVIILFLVGIILICLGLIALYIGKIHSEVSKRPLYVVRKRKPRHAA